MNTKESSRIEQVLTEAFKPFGVLVVVRPEEYQASYKIYPIAGWDEGDGKRPLFKSNVSDFDLVSDKDESQPLVHGAVKWDGCSDWYFDCHDSDEMVHFCDAQSLIDLGTTLRWCWQKTADICPKWSPPPRKSK